MLSGDRHFLLTCGMQRSQGHQCAASSARKEKTGEIPPSNVTGALPQRSFRPVGPGSGGFSREDVPQVKGQPGCSRTPPAVAPTASAFRDIQQLCSQQENQPLSLILTVHDLPRNSKTYASPPPPPADLRVTLAGTGSCAHTKRSIQGDTGLAWHHSRSPLEPEHVAFCTKWTVR